jgi:hypothetical protein
MAGFAVMLLYGGFSAADSSRRPGDGLLRALPADTLFCVRINRLDNTAEAVNRFLKGVAPDSFNARTMLLSKLGGLLGDDELDGVNTKRSFLIFGLEVQSQTKARHPMADLFIGILVPVRNYDRFIAANPGIGEPDEEGISKIMRNGRPHGLATKFRRFALLCPPNARDKLTKVAKMLTQRRNSLFEVLGPPERQMAASSPLWLYVNVKEGSDLVEPILFGGLEKMKAQLQKAKESGEGPPMDPAGIIDFYRGIFKLLLDGTEHVVAGLSPSSEICKAAIGIKAVPGSDFEKMVGKSADGSFEKLLGYLDDGAMMNIASNIDRESMNASYLKMFDLFGQMSSEAMSDAELNKLKELTTEMIYAAGDSLAMSFGLNDESSAFEIDYIIEVRQRQAFQKAIDKQLKMTEEGAFSKLYKGFGMEMDFEVGRDTGTYRGIEINAAELSFKLAGEDTPEKQMVWRLWGDGLDYRWAFLDDYCIYSIGANADKRIRKLIDQVSSGGPDRLDPGIRAALNMMSGTERLEAFGTFNYVRALNMLPQVIPLSEKADLSKLRAPTGSNIAFAGGVDNGAMTMQIALPKEHLLEIKSAFETIIPEIEKQEKLHRQKQKEQAGSAQ